MSVIVNAYDGVRPQPRGVPAGESSRPSQGDWVLPHRANGSPPAGREATEDPCHPLPLFALHEPCQASSGENAHKHTRLHTHLKPRTWRELSDHRMPPHLRPDLGPKQTKKTKRALIQTILLALLPWNGTLSGEGGRINHRV